MIPKKFAGQNVIFAENQPEYQPLPALVVPGREGEVITCWELSDEELKSISENKCIYLSQLCFTYIDKDGIQRLNPLQPILPMAELGDNLIMK
jgi:hypothetical protein